MVIGKVNDIYFKTEYAGITNPAIIMVGEVVNLHPSLLNANLQNIQKSLSII
jgi:uroporphyrin-III C-methyltransferase